MNINKDFGKGTPPLVLELGQENYRMLKLLPGGWMETVSNLGCCSPTQSPISVGCCGKHKNDGDEDTGMWKVHQTMPIQSLCSSTILLLLIGEENDYGAGGDNISSFPVLAGASSGESPGRANKQMRNNDRYVEIVGCLENRAKLYSHMGIPWKRKILLFYKNMVAFVLAGGTCRNWVASPEYAPRVSHSRSHCYYRQLF